MLSITYETVVASSRPPHFSAASHVYRGGPKRNGRKGRLIIAAVISAGLHAALFWGNLLLPARPGAVVRPEVIEIVQFEMPVIEPEVEPAEVEEVFGDDSSEAVAPPMLADVPTVTVSVFTQPITITPHTLNVGTGTARIPVGRPGNPLGKGTGMIFDVANIDQPPVVRSHVPPDYPLEMRRNGTRGSVTVEFVVDKQGGVYAVQVISSTHAAFEGPAIAAVQKWKFRPGRMGGRTVNTRVRQVINFNLESD